MKFRHLTTIMGTLLVILALAPLTASAEPVQTHSPDYQKMKAAMDELAQKTGQEFEIAYIK